jgi:hypothetical protein
MAFTPSWTAGCMIAMLRVGWTVAGWAPGVWRTWSSVRFHSMTWWGWVGLGVPGQRCFVGGCASAAAVKETLAASKASVAATRLICFGSSFVGEVHPRVLGLLGVVEARGTASYLL